MARLIEKERKDRKERGALLGSPTLVVQENSRWPSSLATSDGGARGLVTEASCWAENPAGVRGRGLELWPRGEAASEWERESKKREYRGHLEGQGS